MGVILFIFRNPILVLIAGGCLFFSVIVFVARVHHGPLEERRHHRFVRKVSRTGSLYVSRFDERSQESFSRMVHAEEIRAEYRPAIIRISKRIWKKQQVLNKQRARGKPESARIIRKRDKFRKKHSEIVSRRNQEIKITKKAISSRKIDPKTGRTKHGVSRSHHGSRGATGKFGRIKD